MIHIVTDTDANLPADVLSQYGITAVPIQIIFGDEVLRETVDISDEEAYRRIDTSPELPTTSQPPVGEFKTIYENIIKDDPDAVIVSVHLSSELSGTVQSAQQAADLLPGTEIHVFDSRSVSLGQGLMAVEAAEMARQGAALPDIIKRLEQLRDGMNVFFVLKTMDNLAKGGRIGKASHLMGNVLDIKPVLMVENGVIDAHSRHRTWRRALASLKTLAVDMICEAFEQGEGRLMLGVAHGASEEEASAVADELQKELRPARLIFGSVGPGLGVHTGTGAVGICWCVLPE